jgi:hypothetical protein
MKKFIHKLRLACTLVTLIASGALMTGCAFKINPTVNSARFVDASGVPPQHIPQRICLVLSENYVTYVFKFQRGLDPYEYYLGPALESYAKSIAESNFQSVQIAHDEKTASMMDVDFLLTPSIQKVDLTSFVVVGEKQHMLVDVQWTLTRKGSNSALWLSTFEGNAEGLPGTPFDGFKGNREFAENTVIDLWNQTVPGFQKLHALNALNR